MVDAETESIEAFNNTFYQEYLSSMHNFRERSRTEATILCYHGVTIDEESVNGLPNFSRKHIPASEFRRQMETLQQECTLLSMDEYLEITRKGSNLPEHSVIVTFDDGFENNATVAAPILTELNIPATFYVCPKMIGTDRMFWVDEIADCLDRATEESIDIRLGATDYTFGMHDFEGKLNALNAIKSYCKSIPNFQRDEVLKHLRAATKIHPSTDSWIGYRIMSWEQLQILARNKLFTIGGHTMKHDPLTSLSPGDMTADIKQTVDILGYELSTEIKHFAYPEGRLEHYNNHVIAVLQHNGIECCPTAIPGMNTKSMDPFELRRVMVGFRFIGKDAKSCVSVAASPKIPFPFWDKNL